MGTAYSSSAAAATSFISDDTATLALSICGRTSSGSGSSFIRANESVSSCMSGIASVRWSRSCAAPVSASAPPIDTSEGTMTVTSSGRRPSVCESSWFAWTSGSVASVVVAARCASAALIATTV
jgi:hypothetical protein